jgi:hypothetical protein
MNREKDNLPPQVLSELQLVKYQVKLTLKTGNSRTSNLELKCGFID